MCIWVLCGNRRFLPIELPLLENVVLLGTKVDFKNSRTALSFVRAG